MNTKFRYLLLTLVVCGSATAQTSFDVAKIMDQQIMGTARYMSMAGAMSAFGNDISTISTNPAGIATYTKSELNTSASLGWATTEMDRVKIESNNITPQRPQSSYNLSPSYDNISFVLFNESRGNRLLRCFNMGFSYRKLNNSKSSILYQDSYYDANSDVVYRDYFNSEESVIKSYDINSSWNFGNHLYVGATLQMLSTSYGANGYFYEYYPTTVGGGRAEDYHSADMMSTIYSDGYNLSVGTIFRPIPALRFGLSVKTPTWYSVEQNYVDYLYAFEGEKKDGKKYSQDTYYNFISPWMVNASIGLAYAGTALGIEYEKNFVNSISMFTKNGVIYGNQGKIDYKNFATIKVGLEQNIKKISLRCGVAYTTPRFAVGAQEVMNDTDFNKMRMDFQTERATSTCMLSGGIGYCTNIGNSSNQFYFDAVYKNRLQNSELIMTEYTDDPTLLYKSNLGTIACTIGFYF